MKRQLVLCLIIAAACCTTQAQTTVASTSSLPVPRSFQQVSSNTNFVSFAAIQRPSFIVLPATITNLSLPATPPKNSICPLRKLVQKAGLAYLVYLVKIKNPTGLRFTCQKAYFGNSRRACKRVNSLTYAIPLSN